MILESPISLPAFTTRDKKGVLGGVLKVGNLPGNLVLLPYFEIPLETQTEDDEEVWTEDTIRASHNVVSQLVAIDRALQREGEETPAPEWLKDAEVPVEVIGLEKLVSKIDLQIAELLELKAAHLEEKSRLLGFANLLYENGRALENAIEASLRLMGFEVQQLRIGDLEIDHVIVGPSGLRMIGEAEGKDNSAIGITKFRQLESNINEDFDRAETTAPAKGVLFGNGFRFTEPNKRPSLFTEKCMTNATRLGTALVHTPDLYRVSVYILNNPSDEVFKQRCRTALEETAGKLVEFPT